MVPILIYVLAKRAQNNYGNSNSQELFWVIWDISLSIEYQILKIILKIAFSVLSLYTLEECGSVIYSATSKEGGI